MWSLSCLTACTFYFLFFVGGFVVLLMEIAFNCLWYLKYNFAVEALTDQSGGSLVGKCRFCFLSSFATILSLNFAFSSLYVALIIDHSGLFRDLWSLTTCHCTTHNKYFMASFLHFFSTLLLNRLHTSRPCRQSKSWLFDLCNTIGRTCIRYGWDWAFLALVSVYFI